MGTNVVRPTQGERSVLQKISIRALGYGRTPGQPDVDLRT